MRNYSRARATEGKVVGLILLVIVSISAVSTVCFGFASLAAGTDFIDYWNYSDVVLIGEVTNITTHEKLLEHLGGGLIYRNVEMKVETYIKNPLNLSEVVIRASGGTIGSMGEGHEYMLEIQEGERVLVFLWYCSLENSSSGAEGYHVLGDMTGKFVEKNGIWKNVLSGPKWTLELSDLYGLPGAVPPHPPLTPIFSDLTVTPAEIELGENVTIGFVIENIDSQSFTYTVGMQIGDLALPIDVDLEIHEPEAVSYVVTPDRSGKYDVRVDGLVGDFKVKTAFPLQGAIVGAVAGVIGGVIGAWWVKRKRRKGV